MCPLCAHVPRKEYHQLVSRGGIFSQSLVFQAFSHVMVIIDEVSTLQRGPFANSGPHPAILLFDFPIIGSKKKVVVKSIYGYQNLSGEKYKSNEKRISPIGLTSEKKNPKNPPKMPNFRKWHFRMVF